MENKKITDLKNYEKISVLKSASKIKIDNDVIEACVDKWTEFNICRILAICLDSKENNETFDISYIANALNFEADNVDEWTEWFNKAKNKLLEVAKLGNQFEKIIGALLSHLGKREKYILENRNFYQLAGIGTKLQVTKERVRQIEKNAHKNNIFYNINLIAKLIIENLDGETLIKAIDIKSINYKYILICIQIMKGKYVSFKDLENILWCENRELKIAIDKVDSLITAEEHQIPWTKGLVVMGELSSVTKKIIKRKCIQQICEVPEGIVYNTEKTKKSDSLVRVILALRNNQGIVSSHKLMTDVFQYGEPRQLASWRNIRGTLANSDLGTKIPYATRLGWCGLSALNLTQENKESISSRVNEIENFGIYIPEIYPVIQENNKDDQARREQLRNITMHFGAANERDLRTSYGEVIGGRNGASAAYLLDEPIFFQCTPILLGTYDHQGKLALNIRGRKSLICTNEIEVMIRHLIAGYSISDFPGWLLIAQANEIKTLSINWPNQIRNEILEILDAVRNGNDITNYLDHCSIFLEHKPQYKINSIMPGSVNIKRILRFTNCLGYASKYTVNSILGREIDDDSAISSLALMVGLGWITPSENWLGKHAISKCGIKAAEIMLLDQMNGINSTKDLFSELINEAQRVATIIPLPDWLDCCRDEYASLITEARGDNVRMQVGIRREIIINRL